MKLVSLMIISITLFVLPFLNFDLFFLSWFFLIPIIYLLEQYKVSPVKLGVAFGTISLLIVTYWATPTLSRLSGAHWSMSFSAHLLYCIYESLFYILIFVFIRFSLKKTGNIWNKYFLIIFFYIIIEQYFPRIFPYKLGNTQIMFLEISQLISYFGINFLSFLVLLTNIMLYELLLKNNKKESYIIIGFLAVSLLFGVALKNNSGFYNEKDISINIALVQPVSSLEKIKQIQETINLKHKNLYLIVWPESSLDKVELLEPNDYTEFKNQFSKKFSFNSEYLLLGAITKNKNGFYNSAILINKKYEIEDIYSKNKLMIFGEFYPAKEIISKIIPIYNSFTELNKGEIRPLLLKGKPNLGILICYEDLFEDNSVKLTKNDSELLVNITNDSWYGDSLAPYQHLMLSIPRSIESRRFLIRSAYNGISAVISPSGEIVKIIKKNESGYLVSKISFIKEQSFYVKNKNIINLIYYIAFIILFFKKMSYRRN